ncbi:protein WHAT'S THIS FACTOR 9, mitochondrial [Vitis riparia]|uniref:protein WHAT'S THIS FACTOR 9, mitochondrial n=1 Tax=Vitis riparia TaxID=96939 RepID=UPI00155B1A21|nr:protein WHAT'S THIS FACTOR 9, mitochondrial [Vitis riparia]XP_034700836.1 protein WHAT'S THIS FACTOR 9, mitochondrial [Vitis riparia]XP_034700837.1 protein WHAT'S THIS FACTOR 9, mitochondrial [Vitis riparia]
MALLFKTTLKPQHHRLLRRTFIAAKIKWVRDPYLDEAVSKEKNLKPLLALKTLILSAPSKTLPAAVAAVNKPQFRLPTTALNFFHKYPSVFRIFLPKPLSTPHVRLTPQAIALHNEELAVHASPERLKEAAERLAKFLMLAGARRLPLRIVDCFRFDLGLPDNYITGICCDFPEYFQISSGNDPELLDLELVSWRENLACSVLEKRAMNGNSDIRKGMRIAFPMFFSRGFDLQKKVKDWLDEWQNLPYISPYENGFHLNPNSDQAEKWAVAVLHELLSLMVSKKTERDNIFWLGEYLGFGSRFKKALVRYAGIFYVSNKIRTRTVVLREAYRKDFLLENHPLMGMRHRYIHLMNKSEKMRYQNADFLNKLKQDCKGDCKLENQAVSCGRRVSGRTG